MSNRLLSSREVRERLGGMSAMTEWRWRRDGDLPEPVKIRGRNYYDEAQVDQLVDRLLSARERAA
ncbi:MAG: helix-turn-helix transcriptional regulator [Reyranellaceae bacterium]